MPPTLNRALVRLGELDKIADMADQHQPEGYRARLQSELASALGEDPIKADLVERLVLEVAEAEHQAAPNFETTNRPPRLPPAERRV